MLASTSSLELAGIEAAMADGVLPAIDRNHPLYEQHNSLYSSDKGKAKRTSDDAENNTSYFRGNKKATLRRGKWTSEEEAYANRLIDEFKVGLLPLTDGTTLRTFLSKLLHCDPMRISKKYVGHNCIGKQVFRRRQQDLERLTEEQMDLNRKELAELERSFLERVAQTNRTKSAAPKNEKFGYGSDEHGGALALWLIPPDDSEQNNSQKIQSNKWTECSTNRENMYSNNVSGADFRSIDALNRINSLEALCALDGTNTTAAKASSSSSSPHSFDFLQTMYGQQGESTFPWSNNTSSLAATQTTPPEPSSAVSPHGDTKTAGSPAGGPATSADGHSLQADPPPGYGTGPRAASTEVPRNSSVENFWMLVNMGDIPCPDKGVLSETLWGAPPQI